MLCLLAIIADTQPTALFVLLRNEIVVFDLMAPSTPRYGAHLGIPLQGVLVFVAGHLVA